MSELLLSTSGLSAYYGKVQALYDVDVTVKAGTVVTVIGPNGAGKSTLLASLFGLRHTAGTVTFAGADMGSVRPEHRVGRGLCLVPEGRDLFGTMSVLDNLVLGFYSRRKEGATVMDAELLRVFEMFPRLKERRKQMANTLSGGERQMLVLGRALMSAPKLLMLDEPSLGLAPLVVREVFTAIARLKREGMSILLVEQNARAALAVADYAYVLETGSVRSHGPASEVAGDRRIVDTYLGSAPASGASQQSVSPAVVASNAQRNEPFIDVTAPRVLSGA